jgi:acetylornithine deacetylase/succinyl-diaminopimelate desuccinylase-like protein
MYRSRMHWMHSNVRVLSGLALATVVCLATPARAQASLDDALASAATQKAVAALDASESWTSGALVRIGGIVSPSGHERARADLVASLMREIGLKTVSVDDAPNAVGVIPGRSGRALVFVSTLDDLAPVADFQKAAGHPPAVEGARVVGPGTNTSSTTAAMLAAARALVSSGVQPEHDLVFAAVAQEETGLVGMSKLYDAYKDRAVGFVDILGDGQSITYGAITIHWWRIVGHGPAGHSLNGGVPNVNQGIGRAVDRLLSLPEPASHKDTRTVLNVAMLQSGAVFNHKPDSGWFSLDIRSLDGAVVAAVERHARQVLDEVAKETSITFEMQPVQMTPGGQIPGARDSSLVRTSQEIARQLKVAGALGDGGSSNMNVPIGHGTAAIGIGGSRGGNRAEAGEYADIPAMMRTAKFVLLLATTAGM